MSKPLFEHLMIRSSNEYHMNEKKVKFESFTWTLSPKHALSVLHTVLSLYLHSDTV